MGHHLIEDELDEYIADYRFHPHLTLFTQNSMEQKEKQQLMESLSKFKTGAMTCERVSLRSMKTDSEPGVEIVSCILKRAD